MLDITTLAAWGEFLGGIAVVVSLIYLAGQIRQNSKLLRVSVTLAYGEADREIGKVLIENPGLRRVFREGAANRDSLSDGERDRFDDYLDMITRSFQRDYFVEQDHVMKSDLWRAEVRGNGWVLRQPGSQQWWAENQIGYSDDFVAFVDGLIREGEAAG